MPPLSRVASHFFIPIPLPNEFRNILQKFLYRDSLVLSVSGVSLIFAIFPVGEWLGGGEGEDFGEDCLCLFNCGDVGKGE